MTQHDAAKAASPMPSREAAANIVFLAVVACFFFSGFAALIYQAAWLKKLGVLFGTSHIAVATVLAAYMGGLAMGAGLAAKFIDRVNRPVFTYGILEAVIGVSAVLVPLALTGAQGLLVLLFGNQPEPVSADGAWQSLYYLLATFLVLVIPTAAMGATLPLLSRYAITEDEQVGPRIGLLYGVNTMGAVLGALAAGFIFLPQLGLYGALFVGAFVNLIVFGIAVILSRTAKARDNDKGPSVPAASTAPSFHWVLPVMLVSGAVSFTLEVLWTRLLSHVFGGTVYAFSIMLASFLPGIALGG
ncbi:MAG: fused MFS/spermidine synthase, partial [Parvularculaceae bacterium]|nr:fused MFS/spermidine synthase [Parvularculaceae bacterium]